MPQSDRQINLTMSPATKRFFLVAAAFGLFMGVGGLAAIADAENAKETAMLAGASAFFLIGSGFVIYLTRKNAGTMTISDDGLVLDSYLCVGRIDWTNLEAASAVRVVGLRYLGLRIRDIDAMLQSEGSVDAKRANDRAFARGAGGLLLAMKKFLPLDFLLPILGWPSLPSGNSERDWFAFNAKICNHQLLIHGYWLEDLERTAAELQSRVQNARHAEEAKADDAKAELTPASVPMATASKICPMCAEAVLSAAKVCRFCRYNFETEAFVA